MRSKRSQPRPRPRPNALAIAAVLAVAIFPLACRRGRRAFRISGTIAIQERFQPAARDSKRTLVILLKNGGGVPVAAARIVNPIFPMTFSLGPRDLILPLSASDEPLWLEAQLTDKNRLVPPGKGDLVGTLPEPVHSGDAGLYLKINRKL